MKKLFAALAVMSAASLVSPALHAAAPHHEHVGGPKGGRLLDNTEPRAEFLVEKDNTVTISFYDAALKPVAAAEQSAVVIADANGSKTTLEFEKKGDVLVSKGPLPDVEGLNLVVQFRQNAEAKPVNFRFPLTKTVCGGCKRVEYACICGH